MIDYDIRQCRIGFIKSRHKPNKLSENIMNTRITLPAKYTNLVNKLSEEINKNSEFVRNSYGMVL